jgi:hypothetical protein
MLILKLLLLLALLLLVLGALLLVLTLPLTRTGASSCSTTTTCLLMRPPLTVSLLLLPLMSSNTTAALPTAFGTSTSCHPWLWHGRGGSTTSRQLVTAAMTTTLEFTATSATTEPSSKRGRYTRH